MFISKVPYVAGVFIVHSIEIPINRVVFIFRVLIIGAVSLGQRYMVPEVETHRFYLLSSTNWPQIHENVSYC